MSFVTLKFLLFLTTFLLLFYIAPKRIRWLIVLVASYLFYGIQEPVFVLLIAVSTIVDFICAINIEKSKLKRVKKLFLGLSLSVNLGLLLGYKYIDFINQIIFGGNSILEYKGFHTGADFIIPIGISFYTFQTLSYTIDVYRGKAPAEKHLGYFAVFVSFFPQLIAGPIERSQKLIPQIKTFASVKIRAINLFSALELIFWGLFKKIVIADRIGVIVDKIFTHHESFSSLALYAAGLLFLIQVYCDFSAYTLIARGVARLVGVELTLNWNFPLFQTSYKEFWINWHMTLSTWFRDYIYFPLGGNRLSFSFWSLNVLIVFFVSGLWHGANITFILFGLLNGFALVIEGFFLKNTSYRVPRFFKWVVMIFTFGFFFICFRAESTLQYFKIMEQIFVFDSLNLIADYVQLDLWLMSYIVTFSMIIFLFVIEYLQYVKNATVLKWFKTPEFLTVLLFIVLLFGEFEHEGFIYFQF
jgi:D-alanyl-lipoteichoic acid acyltransferase DltB (MBOAT superfamily)